MKSKQSKVTEDEEFENERDDERNQFGRKLSRDDLQDLAKVGGDLLKRTIVSGLDIVKEVSKEIPKEAQHFISARKEQVLQNMTKDLAQVMLTNAMEKFFKLVREHRLEVSFRIVRDKSAKQAAEHVRGESPQVENNLSRGTKVTRPPSPASAFRTKNKKHHTKRDGESPT